MTTIHPMTTTRTQAPRSLATEPDDDGDSVRPSETAKRVYTSADYETAFHVWHGPAGKNLHRTSAITGYPVSTIHVWTDRHNWDERSATLSDTNGRSAAATSDRIVQDLITAGQVPAIIALHEIIADIGHKRRDVAALAMLALGGRPLPKAPTITATRQLGDGSTIAVKMSDLGHLSPQELAHYARTGELPASIPPDPEE